MQSHTIVIGQLHQVQSGWYFCDVYSPDNVQWIADPTRKRAKTEPQCQIFARGPPGKFITSLHAPDWSNHPNVAMELTTLVSHVMGNYKDILDGVVSATLHIERANAKFTASEEKLRPKKPAQQASGWMNRAVNVVSKFINGEVDDALMTTAQY